MKALSIKAPYINWIMAGLKIYELRSWKTNYRGEIILCSSKEPAKGHKPHPHPGHALCIVNLKNIKPYYKEDAQGACSSWQPGLFAWEIELVKMLKPFPIRGALGLFDLNLPE